MRLYSNNITSRHIRSFFHRTAQLVPEQAINTTVEMYEAAVPYVKCQIKSTIQHEGAHRKDEEGYNQDLIDHSQNRFQQSIMPFDQFSSESRAEPIAEQAEENCDSLVPDLTTGTTVPINLNELFEQAVSEAQISDVYRASVKAGTLDPQAQGMYLMQNMGDVVSVKDNATPNSFEGFDGTLWVDVRKIATPFIVNKNSVRPATFQDDGMQPDVPNVSRNPVDYQNAGAVPSTPASPFIPSTPSIGAR